MPNGHQKRNLLPKRNRLPRRKRPTGEPVKLGEKQELFSGLLAKLIQFAEEAGYRVRIRDVYRDERVHGVYGLKESYSAAHSMHKLGLAADLILTKEGELTWDCFDYKTLGDWWKKQHPLCRWGGDYIVADCVHFSLSHDDRW